MSLARSARPLLRLVGRPPISSMSTRHNSTIADVATLADFRKLIATERLTVTDFHAVWCGPCKAIAPIVQKFSETYSDVQFLKVDVDDASDIAQEYGVSAMPTFVLFKDGEAIGKVVGAAPDKIKSAIETYK